MQNHKAFEEIINPDLSSIINNTILPGINRITNVWFSCRTMTLPTQQFLIHCSGRVTQQMVNNPPTKAF
jgi:hypothetical protein